MDQLEIFEELEGPYDTELILEALSSIQHESLRLNHQLSREEYTAKVLDYCEERDHEYVDSNQQVLQVVTEETPNDGDAIDTSEVDTFDENNLVIKQLLDADFALEHAIEAVKRFGDDLDQAMQYCFQAEETQQAESTAPK